MCFVASRDTAPWPGVAQRRCAPAATQRGRGMQGSNQKHMLDSEKMKPRDRHSSTLAQALVLAKKIGFCENIPKQGDAGPVIYFT